MTNSKKVFLVDFKHAHGGYGRYEFDPISRVYRHEFLPEDARRKDQCCGFGTVRSLGVWQRTKTFVALYSEDEHLKLWICNREFDLTDRNRKAVRRTLFPFVKQLLIYDGHAGLFKSEYIFTDFIEDGFNIIDIFTYVAMQTQSQQQKYQFIYSWQWAHDGRDMFDKENQRKVQEKANSMAQRNGVRADN
jgi:hypothetical protein